MTQKSKTTTKNLGVSSKISKQLIPFSRVKFRGEGTDEFGSRYIKLRVAGSSRDIPPFSATQLTKDHGPLFDELVNAGCNAFTSKARNSFLEKLQNKKSKKPAFQVVTRLGWKSGAFVLPNEVVGQPSGRLECSFRHLDYQMRAKYQCRGTLKDWKENVGALCKGNSRLMFAAALACTGPVLRFVPGPLSGGFQITGKGETGKTTAAKVGAGLTFHGLRHTVGTLLVEAGISLDTVRRWLGQKTLAMAIHYSETADTSKQMRGVLKKFDPLGSKTRT